VSDAAQAAPELLTVRETAALLGYSEANIYKMAEANQLPGIKRIGRRLRFSRVALVSWLASDEQRASRPRKGKR
jgi:excisionase family DNA binding protein